MQPACRTSGRRPPAMAAGGQIRTNEHTNEQTNKQTRRIAIPSGGCNNTVRQMRSVIL